MGWCLLFAALATFSKEQGITVVGVCCTYEIFVVQKVSHHINLSINTNTYIFIGDESSWVSFSGIGTFSGRSSSAKFLQETFEGRPSANERLVLMGPVSSGDQTQGHGKSAASFH